MTTTDATETRAELVENLRRQVRFHVDRADRFRKRAEKAEAELMQLKKKETR